MKQQNKLSTRQEQELTAQAETLNGKALEFESPEDMLRLDAGKIAVPDAVAERLRQSIGQAQPPRASWWRRLFSPGVAERKKGRDEE